MRTSRNPAAVDGDDGQRRGADKRRSDGNTKELISVFVTVMLLEETPAVVLSGTLCEDHGYDYHWASGRKPHLIKNGKRTNWLQEIKLCAIRSSWFIYEVLSNADTYFTIIFITRFRIWPKQIHRKSSARKKWKWGATGKPAAWANRNRKQKSKWRTRRSTNQSVAWLAGLAAGVQRQFGWCKYTGKTCAWGSRCFQLFSWITNGVANKSGTGFG